MRFILIMVMVFGFTLSSVSQDTSVDFKSMTLTELRAVDKNSLSKSDKKEHKASLKEKEKAEKARLKAEENRLKAEAKRKKEAAKAEAKYVKNMKKVYSGTAAFKDDFEAFSTLAGPQKSPYGFFQPGEFYTVNWNLKSLVHEGGAKEDLLFFEISYYGKNYLNFDFASLRGGVVLDTTRPVLSEVNCTTSGAPTTCLQEKIGFYLDPDLLMNHYQERNPLEVQIKSESYGKVKVTIPVHHLEGYIRKGQETLGVFSVGGDS